MKKDQRSRTAEAAAAARAYHLIHAEPALFEDPFAVELTSPVWRLICQSGFLGPLVMEGLLRAMRPVTAQVLSRSRYAEDQLQQAIAAGVDQYVIVGAGLDSFALRRRDLAAKLKVYELDHPASQESKRNRLARLKIDLPGNLEFASVDFESESVADALGRSTYSRERPAFFSWLGTTVYLSREAVFRVLESVATFAAAGSEIVFDYAITRGSIDLADQLTGQKLSRFTARRGEPLVSRFDPRSFPQEVCELGFEMVENLSPDEQGERYFRGRADGMLPLPGCYFAHFRVRPPGVKP